MEGLEKLWAFFWREEVWLPRNATWEEMKSGPGRAMPEFQHLLYVLPISVSFLLFRVFLEVYGVDLLAKAMVPMLAPAPVKLKVERHINGGSPSAGGKWMQTNEKDRTALEKAQLKYRKIKETMFRLVTYSFLFLYGAWTMADKPWLRDTHLCFVDLPFHTLTEDVWWYYMLELGFYICLFLSLPFDAKRKDFLAQTTHHVVTISLLVGSWTVGATRVGSLVLLVHDCAHVFLQLAKLLIYCKQPDATVRKVFLLFCVAWIFPRLIYYPFYVTIPATRGLLGWDRARHGDCFISHALVVLLWSLLGLHIYWTYLIFRIIYNTAVHKKDINDNRTDDEDSDGDPKANDKKSK
ncbi:unnamed protein product [Darwinula stevensoni]|uniref:TLC domain-containing protein n=1 Tax=Darwinula stevensoni TaxID=69355 RepID=A0A7R9A5G6_9CRUS|nr:unnamed protein product [Darwinula stevensoni]CAG0891976.1 unnamed protein product [Darwinula stevensoni]